MTIWFDMDGTIADLYGVDGWLEMLIAEDPTPTLLQSRWFDSLLLQESSMSFNARDTKSA